MSQELKSTMLPTVAEASVLTPESNLAQTGDNDLVLLAKNTALLNSLKSNRQMSGYLYDGAGLPMVVRKASEDVAANETYEELVAQPAAAKFIRILGLFALCGATATTITLYSKIDAGAAVQAGPTMANAENGGEVLPFNPHGWIDLPAGAALGCGTSNHAATGVIVVYCLVPNYLTDENGLVLTDEDGNPLLA